MAIGLGLGVSVFVLVQVFLVAVVVSGHDFQAEDSGDLFEQAGAIARYSDERLEAAATGIELPEPPDLVASRTSLEILVWVTIISQAMNFGAAGIASGQSFSGFARAVGLDRYQFTGIWRPCLLMIASYAFVIVYSILAEAIGIGLLEADSTVPYEIVRYPTTAAVAAAMICIGAPASEEIFFRGMVFGGLLKWGFWPAASISALLFASVHFDPGSIIPFFIIGVVMAWLFWSRGSLWDSIIFHTLFNTLSFLLLLAST